MSRYRIFADSSQVYATEANSEDEAIRYWLRYAGFQSLDEAAEANDCEPDDIYAHTNDYRAAPASTAGERHD